MKKMIVMVFAAFVLMGCGSKAEVETKVFEGSANGVTMQVTIEHQEDRVLKQTTKNEMKYKELGMDKKSVEALLATYKVKYDIKGATYKTEVSDDVAKEEIAINYEETDLDELKKAGIITTGEKDGKVIIVSYEATKKSLEQSGLKLKQ